MASLKPSFGIAALSGKIGGTVYARNRGGLYARAWANPTNPHTPDQVDKEAIWIDMSHAYNALDAGQIDQWQQYAQKISATNRLGEQYQPQARNMFSECYTNAVLIGATPLDTPSELTNRPAILGYDSLTAIADGANNIAELHLDGISVFCPSGDVGRVIFYAAPCIRATVRNVNNQFRMVEVFDGDSAKCDYVTAYTDKFTATAKPGWLAHLRLRLIDDASMLGSTRVLVNTIITP